MSNRIDVFVSSTSHDLNVYRDKVIQVILQLGLYPIVMETFNPTKRNAVQLCYDKVQNAGVFVGIYAHRYGFVPIAETFYKDIHGSIRYTDGQTSITHYEYIWALERNIPIFLFLIDELDSDGQPMDWPVAFIENDPGQTRLKDLKRIIKDRHVVGFFYSSDHLAMKVALALLEIRGNSQVILNDVLTSKLDNMEEPLIVNRSEESTEISGCHTIKISIIQYFRMIDFLVQPDFVKFEGFHNCTHDINFLRRYLNGEKGLTLTSLGELRPITQNHSDDRFWRVAFPQLNRPGSSAINFFPFTLSLTSELREKICTDIEFLAPGMENRISKIQNKQISGDLRVYPPGIGSIRLNLALQFSSAVDAELAAHIAQYYEDQLFVDPEGNKHPIDTIFIDTIEKISQEIYSDETMHFAERRWVPPYTKYTLRNEETFLPAIAANPISIMLTGTRVFNSDRANILTQLSDEFQSMWWQLEGTLSVVTANATCTIVNNSNYKSKKRSHIREEWLDETTQLALAVSFALGTLIEEFEYLYEGRLLDQDWLPNTYNYNYLIQLIEAALQVSRAAKLAEAHLIKQGTGVLLHLARKLWSGVLVKQTKTLLDILDYIIEWVNKVLIPEYSVEGQELLRKLENIKGIKLPLP